MRHTYKALLSIIMTGGALLLLAILPASAQMKIGNHPTKIGKSSILELESPNQGLRLTRVIDTAAVNTVFATMSAAEVDSANGMIIYSTQDRSLYLRANGGWRKMISDKEVGDNFWNLTGNASSPDSNFLGTTNDTELHIGADSSARIIITSSGLVKIVDSLSALHAQFDTLKVAGQLIADKDSVHIDSLFIQDSLVIRTLQSVLGDTAVLTIGTDGAVHKMSIDSLLSRGIRSINGVEATNLHLKFDSQADTAFSSQRAPWIDSSSAKIDSTLILNIPNAKYNSRGLVDTIAQNFSGNKTFEDSLAIGVNHGPGGTIHTPTSTLEVNGNVGMASIVIPGNNGAIHDMATPGNDKYRTIIVDVSSMDTGVFTVKLPSPITGRIYTVKKIGTDGINQILSQVVVDGSAGGATIEKDGTTFTINNNYTSVTLQANGSTWYIVR